MSTRVLSAISGSCCIRKGFSNQQIVLPALLRALQMAMIAHDKNCPASLAAGDLGKGKTILLSRLGHVDHDDIDIVSSRAWRISAPVLTVEKR
jgi:hypothetical protein